VGEYRTGRREREKDTRKFGLSERRGEGREVVEKRKEGEKIETGCGMRYLPVRVISREYNKFSLSLFSCIEYTINIYIVTRAASTATTHPEDRSD
jgi:hypothetical protein